MTQENMTGHELIILKREHARYKKALKKIVALFDKEDEPNPLVYLEIAEEALDDG